MSKHSKALRMRRPALECLEPRSLLSAGPVALEPAGGPIEDQQNVWGGYLQGVAGDLRGGRKVVARVPAYHWRHGCGPTAAGMVVGYWDMHGYSNLIPGKSNTQTKAVNAAIASREHYRDYGLPRDDRSPIPYHDKSETGGAHSPDNCLADWMHTSWSLDGNKYGWSWMSQVDDAIDSYCDSRGYAGFTATNETWGDFTWDDFVSEIDSRHPMVFLVDTDGDANTDHFVAAIGYDRVRTRYACYNTWDSSVHWYPFREMAPGRRWGIYGATFVSPQSAAFQANDGSTDSELATRSSLSAPVRESVAAEGQAMADLANGGITLGEITQPGEIDEYQFQGNAGDVVQLVLAKTLPDPNFKPYIKVYTVPSNGSTVKEFWYGQDTQITLPQDGPYLVQIQDDNLTETGEYRIGLESINPASPDPIPLVPGGIVTQSFADSIEKDQFVFDGKKDDVIQLVVAKTLPDPTFKPYVKVYTLPNNGSTVREFWYGQDTQVTLPKDGPYLVQVQDDNLAETGEYRVGLESINPASPDPIPLVPGGIVTQSFADSIEKDQFVFEGQKDDVVQLVVAKTLPDPNFKPYVKVYTLPNNGSTVAEFWFGQNTQITLPKDGTYVVQIHDDNLAETGEYRVGLESINPASPDPIPLVPGGIVPQSFSDSIEKDQFVFEGMKDDVVQLVVAKTLPDPNFKPYVKVYALPNNGSTVREFWFGQNTQITLPKDGTYLVQIQDDNLAETGEYRVGLESINPASPKPIKLVAGTAVRQKIGDSIEKDQFMFNGKAGKVMQLLVAKTSKGPNFKPYVEVYTLPNNGEPIKEFWYGQNPKFRLPYSGNYLVQIQDDNLTDLGTYRILLKKAASTRGTLSDSEAGFTGSLAAAAAMAQLSAEEARSGKRKTSSEGKAVDSVLADEAWRISRG